MHTHLDMQGHKTYRSITCMDREYGTIHFTKKTTTKDTKVHKTNLRYKGRQTFRNTSGVRYD